MSHMHNTRADTLFVDILDGYKKLISDDIALYVRQQQQDTLQQFGAQARLEIDAYLHILQRGGKRIRGALAMAGFELAGGSDMSVIVPAARALEMIHAYILIIDDIQDRSAVRRGGPTAHTALAGYHAAHELAGNSQHFGVAIAINAALAGAHDAQRTLARLPVSSDCRVSVIAAMNESMIITAHGQTNDIMNEVSAVVTTQDIDRVLEWKTAHYTFYNPLRVGMLLAGADESMIAGLRPYAMHAGRAFQITDDIVGTFGSEFASGKSPTDDIREGKRTIITEYALEHSNDDNKNFLLRMLGRTDLTPAQFERCKDILVSSGALAAAQQSARQHINQAVYVLEQVSTEWPPRAQNFLRGLVEYLADRTT